MVVAYSPKPFVRNDNVIMKAAGTNLIDLEKAVSISMDR